MHKQEIEVELQSGSGSHLDPLTSRQSSGFVPGYNFFCPLIQAYCDAKILQNCGNANGEESLFTSGSVCIHAQNALLKYALSLGIAKKYTRVHQGATQQTAVLEQTVTKPPIVIATVTSGTLTPRNNTSSVMLH